MKTRTVEAPAVLTLAAELDVTIAEVHAALDCMADTIGRRAVYTIDERVRPEAAERLRVGRWDS